MKPATRSDWKTKPLPAERARLALDHSYTPAEMEKIRRGYLPEAMEDKWFIYWEDDTLHFHRSWTGICLFVMPITSEGNRFVVSSAEVNRLPDEYGGTDDRYDAEMVLYLVDLLLLGRVEAEFPDDRRDGPDKALKNWHVVGRAMLGVTPERDHSEEEPP